MGHLDLTLALLAKGAFIDAINKVLIQPHNFYRRFSLSLALS